MKPNGLRAGFSVDTAFVLLCFSFFLRIFRNDVRMVKASFFCRVDDCLGVVFLFFALLGIYTNDRLSASNPQAPNFKLQVSSLAFHIA